MKKRVVEGKRVALLATHGFEQSELQSPKAALIDAGVKVDVISLEKGEIRGWSGADKNWGESCPVDKVVSAVKADDYDMLVIPGGMYNPDSLRSNQDALRFTRDFFEQHKPVGAICHGPWVLISAGVVDGRTMTSYKSIKDDLSNAGAKWVDKEVVCDRGLVTSRTPDDLNAFNQKILEELAEGKHARQVA
jgi:protease I